MTPIAEGLYPGLSAEAYSEIDAIGSTRLEWLAMSPLHYRWFSVSPPADTEATSRGTALHLAVLQPDLFSQTYVIEPLPEEIAPGNAKPRATKAYKDAVADLEASGKIVLKTDEMLKVTGMREAIWSHYHAKQLLHRAPERELTALWRREGVPCRGRIDLLGPGLMAEVKTTRSLRDFSPWTITKRGYYRQMGHYDDGLEALGREIAHRFFIAVENAPPYDVGVFTVDEEMIAVGKVETRELLRTLERCETRGEWPGMFPDVQQAQLTDALATAGAAVED